MASNFPLRLYSKSSVGVDQTCKRKLYFNYELLGGIQAKTTSLELFIGIALHDGLAAIAEGVDIDAIGQTAFAQVYKPLVEAATNPETGEIQPEDVEYAKEQATLVEGLLRGFYKHIWPRLMLEYKVYLIEKPMVYLHDDLGMMVKADLVLQSLADGTLWYLEYKSTSSKREEWVKSWETNVQLHSSIYAIEQSEGIEVTGVIVQGLYKGYESYGKLSSPMCYAYKKAGNPPFTQSQVAYKYIAGWRRTPTWDLEGGVKAWVEGMPDEVLADQFPQTPPIFVNKDLIDAFFRQQALRQHQIVDATSFLKDGIDNPEQNQQILDSTFPQNFEACTPSWGRFDCQYKLLCHGGVEDPLMHGYVPRDTAHLEPFLEVLRAKQD